jgi:selenide,water dikinase
LKDRIDRRWVAMHAGMAAVAGMGAADEEAVRRGDRGAEPPAAVLGRVLARLGLDEPGGAALLAPAPPGHQLVQAVDFFRNPVDDPYLSGRIAANQALGGIAARGARPRAALAVASLPPAGEASLAADLFAMLRGGQEVLEAAGAKLIGGGSADGAEPALGFAVTGEVAEGRALDRGGLQPGDAILLSKPLGTGAILAAGAWGEALPAWTDATLAAMQAPPFPAAGCFVEHGATACAHVTGFGLLNHLLGMLRAAEVAAVIDPEAVPGLPGTLEALAAGVRSTRHPANLSSAVPFLDGAAAVPQARLALLVDPQTAGGLLAGVPAVRAGACLAALRAAGSSAAMIGRVVAGLPRVRLESGAPRHG